MRRGELAAQAPIGRSRAKNSSASHWLSAFAQNISWTRLVVRPFGTFSAKQGCSSLLFMLKSNKNLEPVSQWVPNLRTRGKGNKVSLSKPFPTVPETAGRKAAQTHLQYSKILLKVYFAQSVLGLNQELFFCALFLID